MTLRDMGSLDYARGRLISRGMTVRGEGGQLRNFVSSGLPEWQVPSSEPGVASREPRPHGRSCEWRVESREATRTRHLQNPVLARGW
jgi:hypothetical protein